MEPRKDSVTTRFGGHSVDAFDHGLAEKGFWPRLLKRLRRSVVLRMERTLERTHSLEGKTVLDVGCGAGLYLDAFLALGASKVTGVDLSEDRLVDVRQRLGDRMQRCLLLEGDFLEVTVPEPADFCVAMGFFDYVMDPLPYLEKMRLLTRDKMLLSFPVWGDWLWPQRWLRHRWHHIDIRAYRKPELERLLQNAGIRHYTIDRLDRDYFVEAGASK
jgi:SAM-dependent methyltransferase